MQRYVGHGGALKWCLWSLHMYRTVTLSLDNLMAH
ncbi:hypothetical protein EMIT0P176_340029 [Pseudomonas sp. IT-P176]